MASFQNHITQAKNNLAFIAEVNRNSSTHWDWQVTCCFYVAVHLVNAHLANCGNYHFRSHEQVKNALNPFTMSPCRIPEDIYLCYVKLEGLSRRARYLCSDSIDDQSQEAFLTYDKHFAKAIKNLDKLLGYTAAKYSLTFPPTEISCQDLLKSTLQHFVVKKTSVQ